MVAKPHPKQDRNVRETNNKIKILLWQEYFKDREWILFL
jgi:hypothetical protein